MRSENSNIHENVDAIIWYQKTSSLYPISTFLHPGLLPIGDQFTTDPKHNLPNLDWMILHLKRSGIRKINVISEENFKGLNLYYENTYQDIDLNFHQDNVISYINNREENLEHTFIINGLFFSNANYNKAITEHLIKENKATLLSFKGLKYRVGLVSINLDNNRVYSFQEKPIDKTKTVNSNVLIVNNQHVEILDLENIKLNKTPEFPKNRLSKLIQILIQNGYLKNSMIEPIEEELYIISLNSIEEWRKMNIESFIKMYSFLHDEVSALIENH